MLCGIPVPSYERIELPGGIYGFGSRWEGGVLQDKTKQAEIFINPANAPTIAPAIARTLAFDLFVSNEDRHLNNFMLRVSRTGFIVMAFDFGRAWFYRGWPPPPELPVGCHTWTLFNALRGIHGWQLDRANEVLDRIEQVKVADLESAIEAMPDAWLSAARKAKVLHWWGSERAPRIGALRTRLAYV